MSSLRQRIARWIAGPAPKAPQRRMYAAARPSRNAVGFASSGSSSADAELSTSLPRLRAASRQMVRDSAYAKRARQIVVNNVVGSGVGMQAQVMTSRDELATRVNDGIEAAWRDWTCAEYCHTGGVLHFHDFERAAMAHVFEAGEVLVRMHYSSFGGGRVPLALELIEPERLPDSSSTEPGPTVGEMRMGVEVDPRFGRPLAYWIRQRHPGDIRGSIGNTWDRYERVSASDVFHLRIIDRWPQTRGEPWLHAVLRKIDDLNELSGAELEAARMASMYFATIKSPEPDGPTVATDEEADGTQVMDIQPGLIQTLNPGEELSFHSPNRPNAGLDAFMRSMVREMAAGAQCSYESLSRDYSQSNYSSSRLSLLDDRDTWKMLQQWWIRSFRLPLHRVWMRQAVLARAIESVPIAQYATDPLKFEATLFKPRGWSWIDPTKEVTAYKEAIKAGLTTLTDVIAQTADGRDIEDVIQTRKRELAMLEEAGIEVDTTVPEEVPAAATGGPAAASEPGDHGEGSADGNAVPTGRILAMRRSAE